MATGTRTGDAAEVTLREMIAHLNVMDAAIEHVGPGTGTELPPRVRDVLGRLELLAFSAARLHIADVSKVADAMESLVLAAHVRRAGPRSDVIATLRHGVDVLLLLTHDKMRRIQGYPAAELRPAIDALLENVDRMMGARPNAPSAVKLAGL